MAEGVLMYLAPEAVRGLFEQCADVAGAGSRFVFSYVGTGRNGRPDLGRWSTFVLWVLRLGGEPWLWSIRPEQLEQFLGRTGWTLAPHLVQTGAKYGMEYFDVATR